mmetsp:Transcript_3245/g.9171  ORF Transcript_3245/g.9171 Transcript_3245/m.9171 type:complete len:350 (+) Transcript_3245:1501-2550(+)
MLLPAGGARVEDLVAAYNQELLPARTQPSTRRAYWRLWRICLTWGVAWNALDQLIPMSEDTLKAFTYAMVQCGCSPDSISQCWAAIQHRHRFFKLPAPLAGRGEFSAWRRGLRSVNGNPRNLAQPIDRHLVAELLETRPAAPRDIRDKLLTVVGTIACLRTAEIAALQVCDVMFDFHVGSGGARYRGTAALRVIKRKNDSERRGHFPVLGRAQDPRRRVVRQLKEYMASLHLAVQPGCGKAGKPGARCDACPPLFPKLTLGGQRASQQPCSRQMVAEAVKHAVAAVGRDPSRFTGISARKGGLSTATSAGVPEEILYLQSGHGMGMAGRRYMTLADPDQLYATFRAFRL